MANLLDNLNTTKKFLSFRAKAMGLQAKTMALQATGETRVPDKEWEKLKQLLLEGQELVEKYQTNPAVAREVGSASMIVFALKTGIESFEHQFELKDGYWIPKTIKT